MTQRTIFLFGLLVLAFFLFAMRVLLVNAPEPADNAVNDLASKELPPGNERTVELRADQAGWKAVGRGPLRISADGKVDLGDIQTEPDDVRKPGDANTLVSSLPYGMLVGKIGVNGEPFRVGRRAQVALKETVYLAINDSDYSDNQGSYVITLTGGTQY
jgi:hypothetical protein